MEWSQSAAEPGRIDPSWASNQMNLVLLAGANESVCAVLQCLYLAFKHQESVSADKILTLEVELLIALLIGFAVAAVSAWGRGEERGRINRLWHKKKEKDLNCRTLYVAVNAEINLCGTPAEQQELRANSLEQESHTGSSSCHITQDPAAHTSSTCPTTQTVSWSTKRTNHTEVQNTESVRVCACAMAVTAA